MKHDNSLLELLASIGLGRNEAATYEALLQIETVSIRKVAARTGINRGTTYEALKRLVAAGLVSVNKRGQREYYTAESPEKIYDLIRDKRRDLLDASALAKAVVPGLVAARPRPQGRPVVRYYEDDNGVVAILKDLLETCAASETEYYCYSSSRIRQYLYRSFPHFTERRIAAGVPVKVISVGDPGEGAELAERKTLPATTADDASSYMLIYGDKVAVIAISKDLTPYGVVVEDADAAAMQRLLFRHLWDYL
ncbi:MAG TPA: helix-turn-helix domain-containing protein [Candidatus Saccharimonadales bacterium]